MGFEDTVMSNKKLQLLGQKYEDNPPTGDFTHYALEAQAAITWDIAKKDGMQEVVKRIDKTGLIEHTDNPLHETGATILGCPACCWYAYKKEWGIEL